MRTQTQILPGARGKRLQKALDWRQVMGTAHFFFYMFLYNPNNSSVEIGSRVAQADGEFLILLPPPRQHWNYRRAAVVLLCVLSYVGQIFDIRGECSIHF